MAERIFLSNDDAGQHFVEENLYFKLAGETSVHGNSATLVALAGPLPGTGYISDVVLGVVRPALSASGFVSGTITGDVLINSATCLSTLPKILVATTSAQAIRQNTDNGGALVTAAAINPLSSGFSNGAQLAINYNAQSGGSAAAGAAGVGLYLRVTVRYNAV